MFRGRAEECVFNVFGREGGIVDAVWTPFGTGLDPVDEDCGDSSDKVVCHSDGALSISRNQRPEVKGHTAKAVATAISFNKV